jgi:hypothetical protein
MFPSDIGIKFEKDSPLTINDADLSNAPAKGETIVSHLSKLGQNGIDKPIPFTADDFISAINGTLIFRQKDTQTFLLMLYHGAIDSINCASNVWGRKMGRKKASKLCARTTSLPALESKFD